MTLKDGPSSNWLALQKKIAHSDKSKDSHSARKRRKISHEPSPSINIVASASTSTSIHFPLGVDPVIFSDNSILNGERLGELRKLIFGLLPAPPTDLSRCKYLALDCEMVGVGPGGVESSLARVSIVDYHGVVMLDEFVRQRERVTDWRTAFSGVRERDMIDAKSFEEIQTRVADLLKDRILVGHALHNDTKALLLSHPRALQRDTQHLAHKNGQSRGARPALRNLVRDMFAVHIQGGEHSSVTDARATMAVFRLHRKQWERAYATVPIRVKRTHAEGEGKGGESVGKKRERVDEEDAEVDGTSDNGKRSEEVTRKKARPKARTKLKLKVRGVEEGGRKGVSSGLSTVITKRSKGDGGGKIKWWKQLGGGAKGSLSLLR
ncbi:hypothetical protein EW146_g6828 [Bondarzewia mesenterica]|uniref:RNA exonuclease 4 n=1 Tax=Bondarzewia mesenterica TaxID=1095465 RepID=A0A4S4LN44_9AGAM|nr:hypothetical protein EW146_g6828 [Bondarzewia mesenterica]